MRQSVYVVQVIIGRVKMPRLEEVANVALRVPSILVLDMLYKCDIDSFTDHLKARTEDMLFKYKYVFWNIYYLGICHDSIYCYAI